MIGWLRRLLPTCIPYPGAELELGFNCSELEPLAGKLIWQWRWPERVLSCWIKAHACVHTRMMTPAVLTWLVASAHALQLPMEELRSSMLVAHMGEHVLGGLVGPAISTGPSPTPGRHAPANKSGPTMRKGDPRPAAGTGAAGLPKAAPDVSAAAAAATTVFDGAQHHSVPGALHVYQALSQRLLWRCPSLPQLKVDATLSVGLLAAPVASCAVTFMHALGMSALCAWDMQLGCAALATYHRTVLVSSAHACICFGSWLPGCLDGNAPYIVHRAIWPQQAHH